MPIYDFRCKDCETLFEALVLKGKSEAECPQCQSHNLDQQISGFVSSTDQTRQSSMESAKRRNAAVRKEWQHAQAEYERNHHH